ncbi:MAG: serine/threonine protein phosphatase, partial [Bacteroidetes bacterium]
MTRKIAISDIHGCARTLRRLLEKKVRLTPGDELFFLGDYINRGPDSAGVISYIRELKAEGFSVTCLMGNHEDRYLQQWGDRGYLKQSLPDWRDFFDTLLPYHIEGRYILVHAGLNFSAADPMADTFSMMYIRNWKHRVKRSWLKGRVIIHGHTRQTVTQIRRGVAMGGPVISIDAGCYAIEQAGQGHLCAF